MAVVVCTHDAPRTESLFVLLFIKRNTSVKRATKNIGQRSSRQKAHLWRLLTLKFLDRSALTCGRVELLAVPRFFAPALLLAAGMSMLSSFI
jgi:hypothetical protein